MLTSAARLEFRKTNPPPLVVSRPLTHPSKDVVQNVQSIRHLSVSGASMDLWPSRDAQVLLERENPRMNE